MNKNKLFVLVHFISWLILAVGVLYNHPSDWGNDIPRSFYIRQTVMLLMVMSVFYINFYLLIPRLLFRQKVWVYIASAIVLLVTATALNNLINSAFHLNDFFGELLQKKGFPRHGPPGGKRKHFDTFIPGLNMLMIGLGITIGFIRKWQDEVSLRRQLEQEKTSTELTLLKAQINPHFFFNTLNTIYSYTISDGDVARTAITNLSKMMRYVLYDAAGRQTPLSKEIAFIREYTDLMKLRITKKTEVLLDVETDGREVQVAPMLFLPLVENAFKHGVSNLEEGYISIRIRQRENQVCLTVRNTLYNSPRTSQDESNGIGLTNTTRRLDLLYAGQYTLSTGISEGTEYEAKLILNL